MRTTKRGYGVLVTASLAVFYVGVEAEEPKEIPVAQPVPTANPITPSEAVPDAKMVLPAEGVPAEGEVSAAVDPAETDRNKDGDLSERELALQDHRKQLEIYDLNDDKKISKDEWKAANLKDQKRGEKFFLIDKDEDGEIDEEEALRFLKERISVDSTYVDAKSDEDGNGNAVEDKISDNAPSEVRFTLFSIPFGD
jgi:hypothetical protein